MPMRRRSTITLLLGFLILFFQTQTLLAQQISSDQLQSMKWRMIGPFRGGRTVGASGVPGQPNVFYIGVNNGGV